MTTARRQCDCGSRHRTYRAVAKCVWKDAVYLGGEGPWAVRGCRNRPRRRGTTVTLWPSEAEAVARGAWMGTCGGFCHQDHQLVELEK